MHVLVRIARIMWRESALTFNYSNSRRGDIFIGVSSLFLAHAVSDFFDRPPYEGEFVSSFVFTAIVVVAYFFTLVTLLRIRAARRGDGEQEEPTADGPSAPPNTSS